MMVFSGVKISRDWLLIAALASLKLLLHLTTNTNYELHRDAYLYLAMADHLDFGYVSVPPAIAIFAKIALNLLPGSVFAIRLLPALVGVVSVVIIGLAVKELGGKTWAILLACLAFVLSPAFLRSNTLFQPVSFNQFYWLLASYYVVKMLNRQDPRYWLHLGIIAALGFLNKYSMVFFAVSILLAFLVTPHRKLLLSRYLAWGLAIGLLLILPNLIWQARHNWPVVSHMAELQTTQLAHVNPADFLMTQLLMNLHADVVWLFGLGFLFFARQSREFRVLGYAYLTLLLILLILRGKHYYTLGFYPILFVAGGLAIEKQLTDSRFYKPAILGSMLLLAFPVIPYSLPILPMGKMVAYAESSKRFGLQAALRWEDGRIHPLPQDYADMTGWQELGELVRQAYVKLDEAGRAHCAVYAENYGEAGAIKYYCADLGLPEPISFNGSFLFWAPDSVDIQCLIYVNDDPTEIKLYFERVEKVGEITNPYARESGLPVFLCTVPRAVFADFYARKVKTLKSKYNSS